MEHIVAVLVDGCKVSESRVELGTAGWDQQIGHMLQEGQALAVEAVLAAEDKALAEHCPPAWESRGLESRRLTTVVGEITIRRRVFRTPSGQRRKPLDERLGLVKYQRATRGVQQMGAYFASLGT